MKIFNRLGDYFGRKFAFLAGIFLFSAASLIGGFADNQTLLIAGRALQGLGAAVLSPATLTILTLTFSEPAEKAAALGKWSATAVRSFFILFLCENSILSLTFILLFFWI